MQPEIRTKPRTSLMIRLVRFVVILVILFSSGVAAAFYIFTGLLEPVGGKDAVVEKQLIVPQGATTQQIGNMLFEQGLIQNTLIFRLYVMQSKLDGKLKAGEYNFDTGLSTPVIIERLVKGENAYYSFTIPEGYTIRQIADKLEQNEFIDRGKFMDMVTRGKFDYDFLQGLPEGPARLEGYLFPSTYNVTKKTTEEQIINMMLARFAEEITPEFREKAAQQGLNVHQAVTLASIVEREANKDDERPKVAAVFLNRIKKGWRLESCATIQYILGEPKARLLNKDLQIESPHNTYKYAGLPPGPIASPGRPSLQAVITPANVDYMFFVVSEDGKHVFSRTLAEHNRNKSVYLDSLKKSP